MKTEIAPEETLTPELERPVAEEIEPQTPYPSATQIVWEVVVLSALLLLILATYFGVFASVISKTLR